RRSAIREQASDRHAYCLVGAMRRVSRPAEAQGQLGTLWSDSDRGQRRTAWGQGRLSASRHGTDGLLSTPEMRRALNARWVSTADGQGTSPWLRNGRPPL